MTRVPPRPVRRTPMQGETGRRERRTVRQRVHGWFIRRMGVRSAWEGLGVVGGVLLLLGTLLRLLWWVWEPVVRWAL